MGKKIPFGGDSIQPLHSVHFQKKAVPLHGQETRIAGLAIPTPTSYFNVVLNNLDYIGNGLFLAL